MHDSSARPSLYHRDSQVDDRSIPPQSGRHPNIRVESNMPTKAEVTATSPPEKALCTQTHRRAAPAHRYHHLSLTPMRNSFTLIR